MKRMRWVFLVVLPLSLALYATVHRATGEAREKKIALRIHDLQNEAAALVKEGQFARAADTFEELQVLLMNEKRCQEALDASLKIEEVAQKVSERRSPWNYVRIAEAYLGLGDQDKYVDWMEKAVYERSVSKPEYFQDARFDALRNQPRYLALVEACANLVAVGQKAKDFQVALLDGSSFTLSAQAGKVVLIDFWDVLCPPCRREMPNLKEILRDFENRGLEIVGISLDTDRRLLGDYVKQTALPWKIACSLDGWNDGTAVLYRISATPSTWLVDRHGVVRYHDARGAELRRAVELLIGES